MAQRLNRKAKKEISFKASLFRFTTLFVIVLISGLITNVYISRIDLKKHIPQEYFESEEFELSVDDPQISFKKGLFPVVGVMTPRVEWKDKKCPSRRVMGQNIFVILDFFSLLKGQVKPGKIDIGFVEVATPISCDETQPAVEIAEVEKTKEVTPADKAKELLNKNLKDKQLEKFFIQVQKLEAIKTLPIVDIKKFVVKLFEGYKEDAVFKGEFYFKRSANLMAKVVLSQAIVKGHDLPLRNAKVEFHAGLDHARLKIFSNIREGQWNFQGLVSNTSGYKVEMNSQITKLPLSTFSPLFFDKTQVSYLWLDCGFQVEAPWAHVLEKNFSLSKCDLTGPYGSAKVIHSDLNLRKVHAVEIELNKIQVDNIIKSKRDAYFSGVFSHYGSVSSLFKFNEGRWIFDGLFEGSELIFSRNNLRDIQKVQKFPFQVKGDRDNWEVLFKDILLDEGEFKGEIVVQFKDGVKNAQGKMAIHKLELNPKIYKLMVLSQPFALSFYGKLKIEDKKLTDWSGLAAAKNIKGENYNFSALKIDGKMGEEGDSLLRIYAPSGEFTKNAEIIRWIEPTHLGQDWGAGPYKFREFSTKLEVTSNKVTRWKRGYARLENGWQLSSEGVLNENKLTEFWLQWDKPNQQFLKWTHPGPFLAGGWAPQTPWVKDWIGKNPEFLSKFPSVRFVSEEAGDSENPVAAPKGAEKSDNKDAKGS